MKIQTIFAVALAASATFAQEIAPAPVPAPVPVPAPAPAESGNVAIAGNVSATTPIPAETAREFNKAATTHVKTSAKGRVDNDIDAWCKEMKITLGYVKGKDSFYIKGVERVTANVKDPVFVKSRSLAYAKAYQNAVSEYIFLKFGKTSTEQFNRVFNDFSQGLPPSTDVKGAVERIAEKTAQLTEAQLDAGLRKMGIAPNGSTADKRKLAQNLVIKQTIKDASGDAAGLLPVQTFEGWDESGKYAVGVVIRGGIDTEIVAECLKNKMKPTLSRPEAGMSVADALPSDDELVSQFGVRLFFDEKGTPALLSIGQWGSSYTGEDEELADAAEDHAREQALDEADDALTMFINSTLTMRSESDRGEETGREVETYADGSTVEKAVKQSIDRRFKESTMRGNDTASGRATVAGFPKIIKHPSGHKIAVCARVWSFDQYNAINRVKERPTVQPVSQPAQPMTPGTRRGRTYDF